jgi:hypothetical protein
MTDNTTTTVTTTASSPVTVPSSPPVDNEMGCDDSESHDDLIAREELGTFLASGMSEDSSSFFDNLMVVPDWASPDEGCGDITMD